MARIPYPDPSLASGRAAKALARLPPMNAFLMLAHLGEMMGGVTKLGIQILSFGSLDPVLREIAIVRVGVLSKCKYELQQHETICRRLGMSPEMIAGIYDGPSASVFNETQRLVMMFTDDVVLNVRAGDEIFGPLCARLGYQKLEELTVAIGFYMMFCRFLETFDVDLEEAPTKITTIPGAAALS
jgi:AhpD family alkylhydroperoxidase